ncbi:MAG: DUF4268 domain-containing protein [Puniceicoccaceae bacterium]
MTDVVLGDLERVSLRDVWADEAASFTPWLAKAENLKRLGNTLGMELETEDKEVAVGPFSADILCKDTIDGSWVVIENQIEKTDHRHLGQILTYAAGLDAKTMVWVAANFTDEHRAALDWLNENTDDKISFFGLEIEVWKIGNSVPAPKFNIVSKPNDWSKAVKGRTSGGGDKISPHKQLQFEFWTAFRSYVEENSKLKPQKPGFQHWLTLSIGRSGFVIYAIISSWNSITEKSDPEVRVEFVMLSPDAKKQMEQLLIQKEVLQEKIDLPLVWHNPENSKSCKIFIRRDGDFTNRDNWNELFEWLLAYMKKFDHVFRPIVKKL